MASTYRNLGCERVRSLVSQQVDGELSPLEERGLTRHLAVCAGCRAYAADLQGISDLLRAAPPVPVEFPIELQRRRRVSVANLQAVAAAAGVAILAAVFAFGPIRAQTGTSLRGEGSSGRPAYLDSPGYEQHLLRAATLSQQRPTGVRVGGKTIPI